MLSITVQAFFSLFFDSGFVLSMFMLLDIYEVNLDSFIVYVYKYFTNDTSGYDFIY
jgi:site-specific recombinase XerC